jgi:hypothetical protein
MNNRSLSLQTQQIYQTHQAKLWIMGIVTLALLVISSQIVKDPLSQTTRIEILFIKILEISFSLPKFQEVYITV